MAARYDIRTDPTGWTVHDTTTGAPATVEGKKLVGLRLEDADDLADLLSHRDTELAKLRRLTTARDRRRRFRVIDGGKM
jgi:hypothetical protein